VQNRSACPELDAKLTKRHRNCKILQILFSNVALSSALMAVTASAKHFDVNLKIIKYVSVLCINAAVMGSQFQIITYFQVICIQ